MIADEFRTQCSFDKNSIWENVDSRSYRDPVEYLISVTLISSANYEAIIQRNFNKLKLPNHINA